MHRFTLQINLLSEHKAATILFFLINLLCQGGNKMNEISILFSTHLSQIKHLGKCLFPRLQRLLPQPLWVSRARWGGAVHKFSAALRRALLREEPAQGARS